MSRSGVSSRLVKSTTTCAWPEPGTVALVGNAQDNGSPALSAGSTRMISGRPTGPLMDPSRKRSSKNSKGPPCRRLHPGSGRQLQRLPAIQRRPQAAQVAGAFKVLRMALRGRLLMPAKIQAQRKQGFPPLMAQSRSPPKRLRTLKGSLPLVQLTVYCRKKRGGSLEF